MKEFVDDPLELICLLCHGTHVIKFIPGEDVEVALGMRNKAKHLVKTEPCPFCAPGKS